MKTPYIEIDESLGQLRHISMPSQDVYHLTLVSPLIDELTLGPPKEIYAIPQNYAGKVISKRALAFGQKHGELVLFDDDHGKLMIEYELKAYRLKTAIWLEREYLLSELLDLVTFGREQFPTYFGEFLPPAETPFGPTIRWLQVCNGIYFVESCGVWFFSVCYPIWQTDLSIAAQNMGQQAPFDEAHNIDQTFGWLFFREQSCALAIYELLIEEMYEALNAYLISKELLIAAVWEQAGAYVKERNQRAADWVEKREKEQKHGQNQTFLEQFQAREIIPPPTVPAETFLHLPE